MTRVLWWPPLQPRRKHCTLLPRDPRRRRQKKLPQAERKRISPQAKLSTAGGAFSKKALAECIHELDNIVSRRLSGDHGSTMSENPPKTLSTSKTALQSSNPMGARMRYMLLWLVSSLRSALFVDARCVRMGVPSVATSMLELWLPLRWLGRPLSTALVHSMS